MAGEAYGFLKQKEKGEKEIGKEHAEDLVGF